MPIDEKDVPTDKSPMPRSEGNKNQLAELYNNMNEKTFFKSPVVESSYKTPYNPDDLWQKYGDYRVYERMGFDDQVSVCLRLKKDLVLGDGGHIVPGGEGQEEIVEDLENALFEDFEGDFMSAIEEIITGYDFGFSLSEKVFKLRENGMLGLKCLRTRHPNSWRIHQDEKGSVEKYEQITVKGNLEVDPRALTHYINDPRFQNPYGTSDLRAAYYAYFAKTEIVKYFAIFMEKASSPMPVGRYDKNAPQAAVDKLFEILKRFQTKTAITIPKDIEVEFLEAKNNGEVFVKAIHLFNMFIGRALFIPDLVGFTGSETGGGSLALGKEQMNLFFMHIYRRRSALESIINKQFIWPIVMYNHGFVKNYPKFRFKPLDDMKAVELAKIWLDAVKSKTWVANPEEINHFRKLVKFPEGDVEMAQPSLNPLDPNNPLKPGEKPADGNEDNPQDQGGDDETGKTKKPQETGDNERQPADKKASPEGPGDKKSNFAKVYSLPDGDYHKKVDFKAIETKLNDYDSSVMNDIKPIVKKMLIDLVDQIDKKKILQGQHTNRIDALQLKFKKELKQCIANSFKQIYKDAQSQAAVEINKSEFAKAITPQKFLDIIEDETFKFVGDYEYAILKKVRVELIAAIKDGKSLAAIEGLLNIDLQKMSETQVARFARTKHTEVLNNARLEFFKDSGVVAGYQYSAILDDATSDICAGLNGKKFVAGDEPVPPMHFNCRSLLIPITQYEEFKPTESIRGETPDKFIEDNKGEGFSKFDTEPDIDGPDVDMELTSLNPLTDVYTYSRMGKPFYEVTISYETDSKETTKSVKKRYLNVEATV